MMNDNKALERAEIIAALRYCASEESCEGCPLDQYDNITCAGFSDMLRNAASLLEQDAEPPNEPLTLEELRGMSNTDWVWVVFPQLPPEENCWYRAKKLYDLYSHAHYGETWLAYRRKPDGGGE